MTDTSTTPDSFDPSIPVLTDVVVPGKPEYARAAAVNEAAIAYEAQLIAERLQGRIAQFLSADARALIEARCQDVLREHSTKLVQDITREVTFALETRMREWVGAAVEEEVRRQRGG
ncbi:DUF2486 family protein [Caballeronia sp. Lep1P3]|uniref:DUF2486 family protein n=1 Tax=Caballeronia sp. Lep1P3 TaxID=2878150 RepID=UPI001FD5BF5D|nr:DUF2486 family protein [Caballeronia sp. Lep1P3]